MTGSPTLGTAVADDGAGEPIMIGRPPLDHLAVAHHRDRRFRDGGADATVPLSFGQSPV